MPARHFQQALAQRIQAIAGTGRQGDLLGIELGGVAGLHVGSRHIGLIPDMDDRYLRGQLVLQGVGDIGIGCRIVGLFHAGQVVQEEHGIGRCNLVPGACNADALHLVIAVTQACGVDHMQGHALDLNRLLYFVARGSGNGGDNGQLGPCQRVEQRAFARIGLAGNHHLDAFAQQRALMGACQHGSDLVAQALQLAKGIGLLQKVDFLLGEVQCGLHQHAQMHQGIAQHMDFLREGTRQRTAGTARGGFGAGIDEVGNRLGLGQVDLVVEKSTLGELAGLGQAQPSQHRLAVFIGALCCFQTACQQQLQHHGAAMGLQFQHILARVAVRAGKVDGQAMVYGRAARVPEGQISRFARFQLLAAKRPYQRSNAFAGDPNNAHGTTPRSGGNGGNRVVVAGQHGRTFGREEKPRIIALRVKS